MAPIRILLAALALAGALACAGEPRPAELSPEEQALVEEVVALYTLRILRFANPDSAAALKEQLLSGRPRTDVELRLEEIGRDPKRGELLLRAVHDSLEALRPRLFPTDPDGAQPQGGATESRRKRGD